MKESVFRNVLIIGLIFALTGILSCGGSDPTKIAPPSWIRGAWTTHLDGQLVRVEFTSSDIITNGESALAMIKSGEASYTQEISGDTFTARLELSNGFWSSDQYVKPSGDTMVALAISSDGEEENRQYMKAR